MNNLAIAYHEWSQQIEYDNNTHKFIHGKGIDRIRTVGGEIYDSKEWVKAAFEWVKIHNRCEWYRQVYRYVTDNCMWLTFNEIEEYALDCMLHESYLKWEDFKLEGD